MTPTFRGLVLTRARDTEIIMKPSEGDIRIVVLDLPDGLVKLDLEAPRSIPIYRGELALDTPFIRPIGSNEEEKLRDKLSQAHAKIKDLERDLYYARKTITRLSEDVE